MQQNPSAGDVPEKEILERRPHWSAYLAPLAGLAAAGAVAAVKSRAPGVVLTFLVRYIDRLAAFKALYWGEWAAAGLLALLSLRAAYRKSGRKVLLTNRRVIQYTGRGRGQYIVLKNIFSAQPVRNAASALSFGTIRTGSISIRSTLGRHQLKDIPDPEDFVREMQLAREGRYDAPPEDGTSIQTDRDGNPYGKVTVPPDAEQVPENMSADGKPYAPSFLRNDWKENARESGPKSPDGKEKDAVGRIAKPMEVLDNLVGLDSVKDEVRSLRNFITVQKKRAGAGLPQADLALHTVYKGNPGTGKTTVARIMASICYETGVLPKGHLVETDRSGLVAEYVGQTAAKTNAVIDSALGGLLFIDEAYALTEGGENDYGKEAVTTLLKRMEDDRGRFVTILAGYPDNMERFLESNPGLRSRFSRTISFPDYTERELVTIFHLQANRNGYVLSEEAERTLEKRIRKDVAAKDRNFGNARYVRNLFEKSIQNQADRLIRTGTAQGQDLSILEAPDIHP